MTVSFAVVMRLIRRLFEFLGISSDDACHLDEWNSGDHLFYYSGESVDPNQGKWRNHEWPGSDAAHGWSHYDTWRHGPPGGKSSGRW